MTKRLDMSAPRRGGAKGVAHVIRLVTMLLVIVGVVFLGVRYYRSLGPKPKPEAGRQATGVGRRLVDPESGEVEYTIDVRTLGLPRASDNTTVSSPPTMDNTAELAAVIGLGAVTDGARVERQPLYYLLREVEKRRPADDLFMKRLPLVSLSELRADPDRFRFQPVAIRGQIIRLERSSLEENPSGIRMVLEGDLVSGREGLCMFVCSRPVPVRLNQDVEIRGLFMKLVRYAGKGGEQEEAPLVVASHPVPLSPSGDGAAGGFAPEKLIALLVALIVIYFVMMFVLRRRQQTRNPVLEARRKARELTARKAESNEENEEKKTWP